MPRSKLQEYEFAAEFDRLPDREKLMDKIRRSLSELAVYYGFEKMSVSPLENPRVFSALLKAGMAEERKFFNVRTRSGKEFIVRTSPLVGLLRAYGTHKMSGISHSLKFFSEGESLSLNEGGTEPEVRPEWAIAMFEEDGSVAEAEMLQVVWKTFENLGISTGGFLLRVNATGCQECRPLFRSQYTTYFRNRAGRLCKNCKRVFRKNPTRVLECREEKCQIVSSRAPEILDFLCENCKKHLKGLLEFLDEIGISYFLDPKFFRDGSWFNLLIFEVLLRRGEAGIEGEDRRGRFVIAEGGRLSRAAGLILGKRVEVAGMSVWLDKIGQVLALIPRGGGGDSALPKASRAVFLVHLGEFAKRKSLLLLETLRRGGIEVKESLGHNSIKSQLRLAEREGVEVALILGHKEALDGTVIVRELKTGIQEMVEQEKLVDFLKQKLEK